MNALLAPLPTPCLACRDGVPQRRTQNAWVVRKASGLETRLTTTRVFVQAVAHVTAQLQAMQAMQSRAATYVWIRKRFDDGWYEGYVTYQEPWYEAVYSDGDQEDLTFEMALELATAWIKHACLKHVQDKQNYEQSIQQDAVTVFVRAPPHKPRKQAHAQVKHNASKKQQRRTPAYKARRH